MNLSNKQEEILRHIDDTAAIPQWQDWTWQMRHCVKDVDTFERLLGVSFSKRLRADFKVTIEKFPMSVTPYYLSLIDTDDFENDPVFKQSFPVPQELNVVKYDMEDPLHEDSDSPVPYITHRYPDRALLLVSNMCAMYCRHCTRKRRVGDTDSIADRAGLEAAIDYIKKKPQIRDVLLSGGDPLMLSDANLDWILSRLRDIEHVEIIRVGSRLPVVLPYRITDGLVNVLKKYHPIYLNTHFNHPRELTASSREALAKLANAGIPLGNQTVLLAGINDCQRIIRSLVQKLVANRVRPYYLYQCDLSEGLSHLRTPVGKGIEIMESLIGHTSGLCVPTYVIDAPGGGGKIPVMPNYLVSWSTNKVVLRNYEGVITTYKEPDSYEPIFCDRNCDTCDLQLSLEDADESKALGISTLLSDIDNAISLVPASNERLARRR
ncbi:MAG: lysine 2,3-aminomutase [Thermodesulfobacteriota bacterium]